MFLDRYSLIKVIARNAYRLCLGVIYPEHTLPNVFMSCSCLYSLTMAATDLSLIYLIHYFCTHLCEQTILRRPITVIIPLTLFLFRYQKKFYLVIFSFQTLLVLLSVPRLT